MPAADPLSMSALELAAAIRSKELSARAVVGAHVAHARAVNPEINAIVVERYEAALREAELADERLAELAEVETLPPLFGVPCTIKESFAVAGLPNTSGLVRRRDVIASEDATTVARLRAAGAICIGLTNVSELCMWMESNNRVYGRSNNPYDLRCIVGGSSGGEGAIVGAGASPFGLGADIGGSIRLPAFFCGVFGHKSTGGVVPGTGMHPLSEGAALRYLSTGPIARRAADLMPLMRILAGPDGHDAGVRELELGDPESVDLASLEVFVVEDNGRVPVDFEMGEALDDAARTLASLGAKVVRRRIPELARGFELWSAAMASAAQTPFRELLGEGEPIPVGRELLRWVMRRSQHTLPALVLAAVEDMPIFVSAGEQQQRLVAEGLALRAQLEQLLGPRGVLLFPTHPRPAPRHYAPLLRPLDFDYTGIFNIMELPVTQVPMGLSRAGLPLGLQVVGGAGRDHVTIATACALEREHGGWVRPAREPSVAGRDRSAVS
ncbi:Acylamidase [Enhygromyxa salina]|uniref:Acylamidase n=1 Tax=Enhygromyxa salina TaxID=215803 RepID=A0A2S9XEE8_9BACT|nr:amidase [Enhygromyxa salina]PRP91227.1 Acylamidase [Enhygromyxa salina]